MLQHRFSKVFIGSVLLFFLQLLFVGQVFADGDESSGITTTTGPTTPASGTTGTESTTPASGTTGTELTTPASGTTGTESTTPASGTTGTESTTPASGTAPTAPSTASPPTNLAPKASFTSTSNNLVVTFKSTSSDSDGTIVSYEWNFGDGTPTVSAGATTTHTYAVASTYTARLAVTDNGGLSASAEVPVTVSAVVPPPVAVARGPREVFEATKVTLDGSSSTGASLTYEWIQDLSDAAKVILTSSGSKATFTAPKVGLSGLDLHFTLTVTDGVSKLPSHAVVTIKVDNDPALNSTPVADAGSGIHVEQGNKVTLSGKNSSDADGDDTIVSYTWTQSPQNKVRVILSSDLTKPDATFVAPAVGGGSTYILNFELEVEDNEGAKSLPAPVVVNVALGAGGSLPVADAGPDQTVAPGAVVQLDGSASRGQEGATADSSSITSYFWASKNSEVVFSDPTVVNPTFTVPANMETGSLLLTLQVVNAEGLIAVGEVTISIGENPPVVEAGEPQTVGKGSTVTLTGSASDNSFIESRLWKHVGGLPVELIDPSSEDGKTTFVAPDFEGESVTLRFEFQATDNENLKSSDVVEITVKEEVQFSGSSGGGLGLWSLISLGVLFRSRKVEW